MDEGVSPFDSGATDLAGRMAAAEGSSEKREAIIRAALALFAEFGYHATSLRRLADEVGIEAGSLYNHISSKSGLLREMLVFGTDELLVGVRSLVEAAPDEPSGRLRVAIAAHVRFHCIQREQVLVLDRELRVVAGEDLHTVMRAREEYESLFRTLVEDGVATGALRPHDVSFSVKAILRLGPGTAAWFRRDGRSTAAEIGELYADLLLRGLVAPPSHPANGGA
jgi:AcrR family transcriptional regulator